MMKPLRHLALLVGLLASGAAFAVDNTTLITPCASSCVTMRSRDIGAGVQSMIQILGDTAGSPIYGTAGASNSNVLSVQGIAGGTAQPVTGTLTAVTSITNAVTAAQPTAANLNATVVGTGTFATQATQAGTWTVTGAGGTFPVTGTLTAVTSITNPVTVAQATAGNLNATVVGTGTFATQASQSGTWTVQPGNTANTTAWLVTGSGGTFPVTATNLSTNINQINGVTPLMGQGATGTGSPRVTIANDNSPVAVTGTITAVTAITNPVTVAQGTAANLNATVVGTGTFATQSAQSGNWTVRNVGNAGAILDFAGQNATSPANSFLIGGQFNTTPTTITTGNASPLQLDAAGNLKVNVTVGGGTGGTSSTFGAAFPAPGTAVGFTDGTNMVAGRVGAVANIAAATGMQQSLAVGQYNATPLTVTDTRYQSLQVDVNGFLKTNVTNANTNGQATMANSSPVTIASNQSANALWGHVATGAAPPANTQYIGANTSGATGGLVQGLIQCDSKAIYDASTNGSTELVALTSGRTIHVCGYSILAGGTVNVKLIYGTGTACATGSNNMTPAFQLTAQVGLVDGSPFARGLKTASANALCINTSAGVAAQAIVYYAVI